MLQQQRDHRLAIDIILGPEPELRKAFVLAHQFGRRRFEHREDSLQRLAIERMLEILDGVELDAALAQNLMSAARLPSAWVMVNDDALHGFLRTRRGLDFDSPLR